MLPNIITCVRIAGTGILLFLPVPSVLFITVYSLCGLSDVADGFLARKLKMESELGAKLDSIADLLFLIIVAIKIIPMITWRKWLLIWVLGIAIVKVTAILILSVRFRKMGFIHTYMNKITGALLFLLPFFISLTILKNYILVLGMIATVTAVEELILAFYMEEFDPDRKGLIDIYSNKKKM